MWNKTDFKQVIGADYARCFMAYYCMPTLLKLKPSSLISVSKNNLDKSVFLKAVEAEVKQFGCSYEIIYENKDRLNLFIYQEELLEKLLINHDNVQFLKSFGYEYSGDLPDHAVGIIKSRLEQYHQSKSNFPHEIGIILGYPVNDVEAFIRYQGKQYILSGYWKVYHNAKEALDIFERYDFVRQNAIRLLIEGCKLKDTEIR